VYVLRYLQGTQKLMFWFQGNNDMCMIMYVFMTVYDDDDDVLCAYLYIHP
jgi:hypothetical protein